MQAAVKALQMWGERKNTYEIARAINWPEHEVYRLVQLALTLRAFMPAEGQDDDAGTSAPSVFKEIGQ